MANDAADEDDDDDYYYSNPIYHYYVGLALQRADHAHKTDTWKSIRSVSMLLIL